MRFVTSILLCVLLVCALAGGTTATGVYVFSSGNATVDNAVRDTLEGFGHDVTIGVEYWLYDGAQSLAGANVVYLQPNTVWNTDMPTQGQNALLGFIGGGGGMVTSEWVLWMNAYGNFSQLAAAFPSVETSSYSYASPVTFTKATPDAVLNAGVPDSFVTELNNYSGTFTFVTSVKPGAQIFYEIGPYVALSGWSYDAGRVLNFSTDNGPLQLGNASFAQLFSNSMIWAGNTHPTIPELPAGLLALIGGASGLITRLRRRIAR